MLRFLFDRKLQPQGANILKTSIEVQWRLLFNIQYIQNNSQKIQRILSNPFWTHSNNKKKGLIIVGGFKSIVFRARGCKHEAKEGSSNWRDRSLDSRLWLYSKRFSKEKWPNSLCSDCYLWQFPSKSPRDIDLQNDVLVEVQISNQVTVAEKMLHFRYVVRNPKWKQLTQTNNKYRTSNALKHAHRTK